MKKRLATVLTFLVIMLLAFAGCTPAGTTKAPDAGGETTKPVTTTTAAGAETTAPVDEEPMEIIWITYNQFDNPVEEGTDTQKTIEEKFNVKLTIPTLDVHNEEQWTTWWASGNMADRINSNNMSKFYKKFADQDLIRPISQEMLDQYAPDWMNNMTSLMEINEIMPQITYKGEIWGMPYTNTAQAKVFFVTGVRQSYLDKVGITALPKTLDDLHDMFVKFTKEDPDGNGKDDTYGLSGVNGGFDNVFYAYGAKYNMYQDVNGKVEYSGVQNEFKEAMKVLAQWYSEGIIDPEFVTDDRAMLRAKWTEGTFGAMPDHPWWWASSTADNVSDMIYNKYDGEQLVFFGPVTGPSGSYKNYAGLPSTVGNAIYFGADTSDEKVIKIMEIENAFCADMDLYIEMYYGVEGETFDYDSDGVIIPKADLLTAEKISDLGIWQSFALIPTTEAHFKLTTPKADMPAYDVSFNDVEADRTRAFLTSDVNVAFNEKSEDVTSVASEFYYNVITGKWDLDAEWDNYIAALDSAGLQEILAGYEEVIIR